MSKKPFISLDKAREIQAQIPTPFHLYDEQAIRENARKLFKAFSWNKGFREYFAVKATPNPVLVKILKEEGCGLDCATGTELVFAEKLGITGHDIMFSSNVTPAADFQLARKLDAIINLDDISHIDFLENVSSIPEVISCRYNPGGDFKIENEIMDTPGDAKYGFTRAQISEGFKKLLSKGVKEFGIHAFLASNTVANEY